MTATASNTWGCTLNVLITIISHAESKHKKQFHSIFINILTAQICCLHCGIEIYDLDQYGNSSILGLSLMWVMGSLSIPLCSGSKLCRLLGSSTAKKTKVFIYPNAVTGQLENSEGHRKISKALTGFFCNKTNYAINSALQFLMQFELFRDILLNIKPFNKYHLH